MILEDKLKIDTFIKDFPNNMPENEVIENLEKLYNLLREIGHRLSTKFARAVLIKVLPVDETTGKDVNFIPLGIEIDKAYEAIKELAKSKVIEIGHLINEGQHIYLLMN